MKWFKKIYLLYLFGFLVNLRPIDPFIYQFYVSDKNLSTTEVIYEILPTFIYSNTVNFLFVFFFADLCGYKSLIIVSSFTSIITSSVRLWGKLVIDMEVAEVFRGTAAATEMAYFIFIYGYYDVANFQHSTAFVRSFPLLGKLVSAILAQMTFSRKTVDFKTLNVINLIATSLATILSCFLPAAGESIYQLSAPVTIKQTYIQKVQEKILMFKQNFLESFNQKYVIIWTIWCIWSTWSFNQITTFIQPLWNDLHKSKFNGGVEATGFFFAIIFVLVAGFKRIKWTSRTIFAMPLLCGIQYIILLSGIAFSNGFIMFNYIGYIIFCVIHHFVITAISAEIAKTIHKNCFGLVFGFIHLNAAILNVVMTCTVNGNFGLYVFSPRQQFLVYFIVFVVLYLVFFLAYEVRRRINSVMTRHQ